MKKISGDFEQFCLCFSFADMCKIRFKRLKPEHRKILYFAKLEFFKSCAARKNGDIKKAMEHMRKSHELEGGEWKNQYDFDAGIELVDEWREVANL